MDQFLSIPFRPTHYGMKKVAFLLVLACMKGLSAQQTNVTPARDGFIGIATDARALGQGDMGVATSADAFSQFWNPSKYVFSDKKFELGITQILANRKELNGFSQLSISFYNKLDKRSAYGLSVRNYAYTIDQFVEFGAARATHEVSIDGSYSLRLGDTFAMSVGGRFISLKGKAPLRNGFSEESASNLYGIDVSGFFYGNEMAYKKFNGRWRAGFNVSNLRGRSLNDNTDIEIYAPSMLKVGTGFDFIFDQDRILGITSEYKMLLDPHIENADGEKLDFGLEGSVASLGLEFVFREKLVARTGCSYGIDRPTDSFVPLGAGFRGRYVDVDVAFLLGLAEEENPVRRKLRISLSLDLEEVFSGERLVSETP